MKKIKLNNLTYKILNRLIISLILINKEGFDSPWDRQKLFKPSLILNK